MNQAGLWWHHLSVGASGWGFLPARRRDAASFGFKFKKCECVGQIFHRKSNTIARATIAGALLSVAAGGWTLEEVYWSPYTTRVDVPREQPVPFSHKHHVNGLGIDCRYCHTSVEKSAFAGIPPTETCMTCHSQLWTDAPVHAPVRESLADNEHLRWNRVN